MKKRAFNLLLLLLTAVLLCACGNSEPQTPEDRAQQFLATLLADDAELQQQLLDSLTVIGEGVPAPTEEELAERAEREARLDEMLQDRFGGLVSPELLARSAAAGSLTIWQGRLACTGAKASLSECSFTDKYSRMVFEATVHCVNGEEEKDLPLLGEVVFNEDGLIDSFSLYEDEFGFTGWLRAQETVSAALQERIDAMTGTAEDSGIFTSYEQVIAKDLELKTTHGAAGFEEDDVGLLRDVNNDGTEELFVFFFVAGQDTDPDDAYCQVWTFDDGRARCVAYDQLYQRVGGAKYGGAGLTELEGRPYLCLWYQRPHSGDAEYVWYEEKYQLFDLVDLTGSDVFFSNYARDNYALDALDENAVTLYQGSFDYVFLKNDEPLPEEEFLAVRQELTDSMEPLVGYYPREDGAYLPTGQPLDELLGELAGE